MKLTLRDWCKLVATTASLLAGVASAPSALRAEKIFCYETCYGYAQFCDPWERALVCCQGTNCHVEECYEFCN